MNRGVLGWFCALALVAWLAPLSARADAMRCGQKLVKDDSPMTVVESTCGAPTAASHWVEQRLVPRSGPNGSVVYVTREVVFDQWTYDFGPTEFVYYLTFENGQMVAMTKGSWGAPR